MGRSKGQNCSSLRPPSSKNLPLMVEPLEERAVPYATIGAWPHHELVTLSFMPDGTYLAGSLYSNLFASFNANWPASVWQGKILLAAQTWAQYTNVDLSVVADEGFQALLVMNYDTGQGAAIMANSDNGILVANEYLRFIDGFVVDREDLAFVEGIRSLGIRVLAAQTIMRNVDDRVALARSVLDFARGIRDSKELEVGS